MTKTEIAWLAGFLEGEGCFHYHDSPMQKSLRIAVNGTDGDVIRRAAALMGCKANGPYPRKAPRKPVFQFTCSGFKAARIMKLILPYMGLRRTAKINEVLARWQSYKHRREPGLSTSCHPNKPHYAKGLCQTCYNAMWAKKPESKARIRASYLKRRQQKNEHMVH